MMPKSPSKPPSKPPSKSSSQGLQFPAQRQTDYVPRIDLSGKKTGHGNLAKWIARILGVIVR